MVEIWLKCQLIFICMRNIYEKYGTASVRNRKNINQFFYRSWNFYI